MVELEQSPLGVSGDGRALALTLSASQVDLAVGAGLRAIRTARTDSDKSVATSEPDQPTDESEPGISGQARSSSPSLVASGTSILSKADEQAKRAQLRVTERKRTEVERKQEEEREKQRKREEGKLRKEQDARQRQRRRAEIYALNALLRQLQQDKIAAFVAGQRSREQIGVDGVTGNNGEAMEGETPTPLVAAIGV